MMEEWVQCYLLLTRNASSVLQDFMKEPPLYFGVVKVPLRLILREGSDSGDFVTSEPIGLVSDFPPLLIQYECGMFYCPVQQQLLASLRERRVNAYPAIIVLSGSEDYKRFMKYYGNIFFYVDKA